MYSWGGSTSDWRGRGDYKFDSARAPYLDRLGADADRKGPRSYARRSEPEMKLVDPRGKTISSDSKNPLVIAVDVTGSMASWPGEIFDRLPLIYQTLSQYEGKDDLEICFAAIGDATCDQYPLQVNDFGKGLDLEERVKALCPEGGGGGQISESYELFAYFMQEHCKTPNAQSPFLIMCGDEKFYENVDPRQVAHYVGDKLQARLEAREIWKGLLQRFDVYFLHKPYGERGNAMIDQEVVEHWGEAIGRQKIIELPSSERAVDIALGLIAKKWGEYEDFKKSLDARHDDDEVKKSVHTSLRHVEADPSAKSVTASRKVSKRTKPLTEK